MFSDKLRSAIVTVAQDCAPDALADFDPDEAGCSEEILLAETALDASRLVIWGFPAEHEEMQRLVAQHGYPAVLEAAARVVYC